MDPFHWRVNQNVKKQKIQQQQNKIKTHVIYYDFRFDSIYERDIKVCASYFFVVCKTLMSACVFFLKLIFFFFSILKLEVNSE